MVDGFPARIKVPTLKPVPARLLATTAGFVVDLEEAVRRLGRRHRERRHGPAGIETGDNLGKAADCCELVTRRHAWRDYGQAVGTDKVGDSRLVVQLKGLPSGERDRPDGQRTAWGRVNAGDCHHRT